jgi:ribonuclease Z
MSISFEILGAPGHDNAVLMRVDTGQSTDRLLFDCGHACLENVPYGEVLNIDHLFFSHLHMDHVGGFDVFFCSLFNRVSKPNQIWGPPGTRDTLHHRFRGFLWNLHNEMNAAWHVHDIFPATIASSRFELNEAFAAAHEEGEVVYHKTILDTPTYCVQAITMDHRTPVIAYLVKEKNHFNINTERLTQLGLPPGPWLQQLKSVEHPAEQVMIHDQPHSLAMLRAELLVETPGDSVAYLTDFLLDETAMERLTHFLQGCHTIICEGQYRQADMSLAQRNYHMTTALSAQLAERVEAHQLVLIHLSRRYERPEWLEMLREARAWFPNTHYASNWGMDLV